MALPLVFIVGVGRSGTSLVQSMLASHQKVAYLPETSFLRRMVSNSTLQSVYENQGEQGAVQVLREDEFFCRIGLDAADIVARALSQGGFLDAAVYREMLTSFAGEESTWVGDKDPRAIEYLSLLKIVVPNTHVVHIFRDPRDVLASKKKAAWSKTGHVWKHVFANRVQFRMGRSLGPLFFGKNYHEICYEELLVAPAQVLSTLCEGLGLEFDENMLSFGDAARKLVSDSEMSWKKETLGPLLNKNSDKWKKDLQSKEIKLTELCCCESMRRGGYQADDREYKLSFRDKLWVRLGWLLILLATNPYILYRNYKVRSVCRRVK